MKKYQTSKCALLTTISAIVVAFACATPVRAEEKAPEAPTPGSQLAFPTGEQVNMGASSVRMLGGFLLCLGVFGAGIHVYRKYLGTTTFAGKRRLRVIERLPVSPKSAVLLLSFDGKEMLVATGPDNLRLLAGDPSKQRLFEGSLDACAMEMEDEACAM